VITIGIRAAPKVVTFAVYDSMSRTVINVEEIKIPAAFSLPDRLKYVRSNLLDVLREYKVEQAGIRETESAINASTLATMRCCSASGGTAATRRARSSNLPGTPVRARPCTAGSKT
jgi:Holliday junction resolvasome RuvABC endonuclease subunit